MPWSLLMNKWVIGALAVAGLGLALWIQTQRLDAALAGRRAAELVAGQWQANAAAMAAANEVSQRALAQLRAEHARIAAAADAARTEAQGLAARYDQLRRSSRDVASNENGPVAAVLCRALDGLRGIERAAGDGAGAVCGGPH